ncbi:MAG: hypothetical protein ABI972_15170 [Acidobacteriota bacterium]
MNLRKQFDGRGRARKLAGLMGLLMLSQGLFAAADRPGLTVCVANPAAVEKSLAQEWEGELRRILQASDRDLRVAACEEAGAVQVYFMRFHPSETSALGAARTRRERVLPMVEVYTEPVAALIGTRLPALLGKAMARVTAHELTHYVRQETEHAEAGGFSGQYTAGLLLAARPAYFGVR